ncbi:uncharacterized protein LOC113315798 [Papaver somniferum]|uniref:uncharacterized protein LOC113315798 n=1 Tax=Papaver somniferum TaxID=3469 RepID=UPI000E705F4B|nr:uncharacterized protein LOC113315798 [Papaver somniferum]
METIVEFGHSAKNKTFLWKCMNDIIPSSERMRRVMQYSGDMCSMCNQAVETTKHIIWECPFARAIWTSILVARRSMDDAGTTGHDWINSWFTNEFIKLDADWIIKMANACWKIWKERCRCVFDGKKPNPVETIWSIGLILRNAAGEFEQGRFIYERGYLDAEHAKIEGLRQAMLWTEELNIYQVCFELDAQTVVATVKEDYQKARWETQKLALDIISLFSKCSLWTCKFINRKNNKPADKLARHSRLFQINRSWIQYPPNFIVEALIYADANGVLNPII